MKTKSTLRFGGLFLFSVNFGIIWVTLQYTQLRTLVRLLCPLNTFATFVAVNLLHA
jgi:hypothetical protein